MKFTGQITIIPGDTTRIRIVDKDAGGRFVELEMDGLDFARALGGRGLVACHVSVYDLDHVGKVQEYEQIEFPLPKGTLAQDARKLAIVAAKAHAPSGWVPDEGFRSQGSFFERGGQPQARTIIRRWVEKTNAEENDDAK